MPYVKGLSVLSSTAIFVPEPSKYDVIIDENSLKSCTHVFRLRRKIQGNFGVHPRYKSVKRDP